MASVASRDARPFIAVQPQCTCKRRLPREFRKSMQVASDWYYKAPLNSLHSERVIATRFRVSDRTLEASRRTGMGYAIPFVVIGRKVRYLKAVVEDWLRPAAGEDQYERSRYAAR